MKMRYKHNEILRYLTGLMMAFCSADIRKSWKSLLMNTEQFELALEDLSKHTQLWRE